MKHTVNEKFEKEELLKLIDNLKEKKKYGLVWDEEKVPERIALNCKNQLPVLTEVKDNDISNGEHQPTHIIIEGDNYHALSVLNYTHNGKIDAIYIDPPYNTGAKDWKYNNDFVDKIDTWRHSKWIQFMYNRLLLAKDLLTEDGSLICAIDHNEQENLGILLREIFGNMEITCITIVHNPRGIQGDNFSYTHEYAYFVYPRKDYINRIKRQEDEYEWENLRNWGGESERKDGKSLFYPLFFKEDKLIEIGKVPDDKYSPKKPWEILKNGNIKIWPIDNNGIERKWRYSIDTLETIKQKVRLEYIKDYYQAQLLKDEDRPKTVWTDTKYDANIYGTQLLGEIVNKKFPFPKSLYTVKDCLEAVIKNKPNAIILDYFAGSGTTGHAVMEINKDDGGNRKFILCTNNESNICYDITYPRIAKCIKGYSYKGDFKETIFEIKITYSVLKKADELINEVNKIIKKASTKYDKFEKKFDGQVFKLIGIKKGSGKKPGYGGNLKFFLADKKSFVNYSSNKDQLKIDITKKCTTMLCLKESIFKLHKKSEDWKVFKNGKRLMGVYYDFASESLEDLRNEFNKFEGDKVLYCFTLDNNLNINEFKDWNNTRLEPIPQKILDIYKRIFNND